MKKKLLITLAVATLFFPKINFGQAPTMGNTIDYVLFTSSGNVSDTSISHITGNVGTQIGIVTMQGNVDGEINSSNPATASVVTDLTSLYTQLIATSTTSTHGSAFGSGETLNPGVYQVITPAMIAGTLNLDAGGDVNAVFIFKISGELIAVTNTEVILMNNAKACNVFWVAEGSIEMGARTKMKGTMIANSGDISMAAGGEVEGRMFSTSGDVMINETTARLPLGCDLPTLKGPDAPNLAVTECFALFTSSGALTNTGTSIITGDIGTNAGSTTGFIAANVTGNIYTSPNSITATTDTALENVYSQLNSLTEDIELMYPATLGNGLVLTPHTYLLDAATVITDTLFLNAQDIMNAVFVLSIQGTLSTSVGATVMLMNGAKAENVYWVVNGNVSLNSDSKFIGTIVSDNGTIDITAGAVLNGRALTTGGIITTNNMTAYTPTTCNSASSKNVAIYNNIAIYPNPFASSFNINLNNNSTNNQVQVSLYNAMGVLVLNTFLTSNLNTIETSSLPSGIYFYKVYDQNSTLQTGRLIAE